MLQEQQAKFESGKVKSLPGAVFTAITKQHLLAEYETQRKKSSPTITVRQNKQLSKLMTELEDARTSLKFVLTSSSYSDTTRPVALDQVRAVIAALEIQVQQLSN